MLAETFQWKKGLDKKFPQAKAFYFSIIISLLVGLSLNFLKISPIKALFYTAISYGLTAPVLIAVILHIGNNKKIMKEHTNSKISNILGFITLLLMTVAAIALFFFCLHLNKDRFCQTDLVGYNDYLYFSGGCTSSI
jgi:Mn2+/Fe2+ NRAMP family transporter